MTGRSRGRVTQDACSSGVAGRVQTDAFLPSSHLPIGGHREDTDTDPLDEWRGSPTEGEFSELFAVRHGHGKHRIPRNVLDGEQLPKGFAKQRVLLRRSRALQWTLLRFSDKWHPVCKGRDDVTEAGTGVDGDCLLAGGMLIAALPPFTNGCCLPAMAAQEVDNGKVDRFPGLHLSAIDGNGDAPHSC